MSILLVLAAVLTVLGVAAAGIAPGTTYLVGLVLAIVYAFVALRQRHLTARVRRFPWVPVAAVALIVWMAFLALPLPDSMRDVAGFRRAMQSARAGHAVEEAANLGIIDQAPSATVSLSRNRAGTWRTIVLVICLLLAAGLTARIPEECREWLFDFLVIFLTAYAVLGFASQWIVPQGKAIWWVYKADFGSPVGSFVNRNHFAGFIALGAPLAMGRGLDALAHFRTGTALWRLACFALMSIAVVSSLSRGAFLAYLVGILLFAFIYAARRHHRLAIIGSGVIVLLIAAGIVLLPNEQVTARLSTLLHLPSTSSAVVRAVSWRNSFDLWADYPLVGVGPEGFRTVFGIYKTSVIRETFYSAENEYVQLLTDMGLVGVAFMVLLGCLYGCSVYRGRHMVLYDSGTWVGVLAGVAVAAAHALVDFAVRIPLYAILLGILFGALLTSPGQQEEEMQQSTSWHVDWRRWSGTAIGVASFVIILLMMFVFGKSIYRFDTNPGLKHADTNTVATALIWAPTHSQAWFVLGQHGARLETPQGRQFAEACLTEAARYSRNDYGIWEDLAFLRQQLGDSMGAGLALQQLFRLRPHKVLHYARLQAEAGEESEP